ncbi:XdhC family protein [Amnibacterium kyonggiense]|uniref:Xanthine dehydrogenase accessory factor n=1 Tax=Amnibacterium kyonggiense TaxID=595671 RepID=A0A4R7FPL8_9MICO|nr:XdhC/CoxI family protein [Amnibacterium kyonggiense]TDS79690.1 xanthine dehydrogenase accessory factor [Amnibacterium kyonggiense]
MLELADRLVPLVAAGVPIALATSIDVIGSSPRPAGSSLAVAGDGSVLGSVSGGCVEDAALAACRALLGGEPGAVHRFGFGDAAAARAGLACGGELDVLVHELDPAVADELRAAASGSPAVIGLVTAGPPALLGRSVTHASADALPGVPAGLVRAALEGRRGGGVAGGVEIACDGVLVRIFADVAAPRRRMVICGATEVAVALAAAAGAVGFQVTVCDPRAVFLAPSRFAPGTELVVGRPHDVLRSVTLTAGDAVCVLGHDEDLDPLALAEALEGGAGFVGALGSRATTLRRRERLTALGVAPEAQAGLRMPIGLDIGARTPAEIAIAVLAEVLAVRAGRNAAPLRSGSGPIHRAAVPR